MDCEVSQVEPPPVEAFEKHVAELVGDVGPIVERLPESWRSTFLWRIDRLRESVACGLSAEASIRTRVLAICEVLKDGRHDD